jgi:hypothetical protein
MGLKDVGFADVDEINLAVGKYPLVGFYEQSNNLESLGLYTLTIVRNSK